MKKSEEKFNESPNVGSEQELLPAKNTSQKRKTTLLINN
jgi:hypothetical protein